MAKNESNSIHRNTEQNIMAAAEELFLEKGYRAATTMKIAEKAGVTHAMLHYYFRTKEQIFIKVLDKNQQELFSFVRPIMTMNTENAWETIKGAISLFYDFLNSHRRYAPMIYDVQSQNPELLNRYKKNTLEILGSLVAKHKEMLEKEMEAGRMNKVDVFQLFYNMLSMCAITFLSVHAIEDLFSHTPERIDEFVAKRKEEIIETLYLRLYGKT